MINGSRSMCTCTGFMVHNHCRHVESLTVLCVKGKV
jgi:hypothetical protein